jgi:hypothetical protein
MCWTCLLPRQELVTGTGRKPRNHGLLRHFGRVRNVPNGAKVSQVAPTRGLQAATG